MKPIGLHSDEPPPEKLDDLDSQDSSHFDQGDSSDEALDSGTGEEDWVAANEKVSDEQMDDFWSYMKAKMKAAMDWAHNTVTGVFGSGKPADPEDYPG